MARARTGLASRMRGRPAGRKKRPRSAPDPGRVTARPTAGGPAAKATHAAHNVAEDEPAKAPTEMRSSRRLPRICFGQPCHAVRAERRADRVGFSRIEFDGCRVEAARTRAVRAIARASGENWSASVHAVADASRPAPPRRLLLDGGVVVEDDDGVGDFSRLPGLT